MQPLVEVCQADFSYGSTPVLSNVTLSLPRGRFAALVGPSGAGKTSLLKLILGSLRATSGSITVAGQRVDGSPAKQIAYVPQVETVDWNFPVTVEQVVMMGRVRKAGWLPWPSAEDRRQVRNVLERLEIGNLARRHIRDLSGGQQQRVFLARALIGQPELLVLDEPTSGVDMRTAETVLHLLAGLNGQGMTILMTTHDLNAAAAHIPWVICLNRTVIAEGPPDLIFDERTLNRTYEGDMIVVRQDGLLLVQQRPHRHTEGQQPGWVHSHAEAVYAVPLPASGHGLTTLITPALPVKEVPGDLVA